VPDICPLLQLPQVVVFIYIRVNQRLRGCPMLLLLLLQEVPGLMFGKVKELHGVNHLRHPPVCQELKVCNSIL
jgi:hypothetical protein